MFVKKIVAVAALGCALLASQAFAYETGEYSKEALRRGDDKPVVVKDFVYGKTDCRTGPDPVFCDP